MSSDELNADNVGKILMIGVTGGTGHQAVRGLRARGISNLVALTRDPAKASSRCLETMGVELVTGDMEDIDSLEAAMQGCDRIYLHALSHDTSSADPMEFDRGEKVVAAALKSDITHLVYNSAEGCDRSSGVDHMETVGLVEKLLDTAGIPNTALRATLFMEEWFKHHTRPQILQGTFSLTLAPDFVQQYIAVRDMGYCAAQAFLNPSKYIGRKIALAGDELSNTDLAAAFAEAQASPCEFKPMPLDVFRQMPGMDQMVKLVEWYERDGYQADVAATHEEFPGVWRMADFLRETGWGDRGRSYESFSNGSFES